MCRVIWSRVRKSFNLVLLFVFANIAFILILLRKPRYLHQRIFKLTRNENHTEVSLGNQIVETDRKLNMKYILLWTSAAESPFDYFGTGRTIFKDKKCKWDNCYVTTDRAYLGYYTEFNAVLYSGSKLGRIVYYQDFPKKRRAHQKYVFANIESAANYPVNGKQWNGFFNWTWTYRLDSDSRWGYFVIKNTSNHIIGPRINMHWINSADMRHIDEKLKGKLKHKTKAAVWISSNCITLSQREVLVSKVQEELRVYGLQVDIFGSCGQYQCPKENMTKCLQDIERDYYFYFAFENALSEDYVTEKLVYALQSNTVPVVYGGANYSRFMPDGIYLDALQLGPKGLVQKMYSLITSPESYYDYFKWKSHYSYHFMSESPTTDEYCHFCAVLNDETLMKHTTTYEKLDTWWNTNISYDTFEGV